jgi:uncharacterized NAD-dependent epimerase/dehydratase family protein
VGVVRYCREQVVAFLDSQAAGKDLHALVGAGAGVPIVASLEEAAARGADTLLIGIAPPGGRLPDDWRGLLRRALAGGMNVISGLHQYLADDPELSAAAAGSGAVIWDVRKPARDYPVATEKANATRAKRVLTVGTDCNLGKKIAALEITAALRRHSVDAEFLATGQTGIMISGKGVPLDNIISDFVSGAAETLVVENGDHDVLLIEGQGGLLNASYGQVTLGLMLGSLPDAMIMVHAPARRTIRHLSTPIPPLGEVIALHERILRYLHPSPVIGVALNTFGLSDEAARRAVDEAAAETGLPATDVVRFGAGPLAEAIRRKFGF